MQRLRWSYVFVVAHCGLGFCFIEERSACLLALRRRKQGDSEKATGGDRTSEVGNALLSSP